MAGTVTATAGRRQGCRTTRRTTRRRVRNQATNAIANSGRGGASTGAAVSTAQEQMVPLSAIARFETGHAPLAVNHQGLFAATTISFNLKPGVSLSEATRAIDEAILRLGVPATIRRHFRGHGARVSVVAENPAAADPGGARRRLHRAGRALREPCPSDHDPVDPASAGVGAVLALLLFDTEFSIIALIGVILLIGIVKKNAIMMIDFALAAERSQGLGSREAIYRGRAAALSPDHDDDGWRRCSAPCRWRSGSARVRNCAGRSASRSSAGCS